MSSAREEIHSKGYVHYCWIALIASYISLAATFSAKSQVPAADSLLPTRDKDGIRTFPTGIGMTQVENMIASSAFACMTQRERDGKMVPWLDCSITEELRVALSQASQKGPLVDFLAANDFKCQKVIDETRCRNEFKTIRSAISDGKKVNPDFHDTYITEVAFRQNGPRALKVEDIKVEFTHFERQDLN
jgi:hypothetical protein